MLICYYDQAEIVHLKGSCDPIAKHESEQENDCCTKAVKHTICAAATQSGNLDISSFPPVFAGSYAKTLHGTFFINIFLIDIFVNTKTLFHIHYI